MLIAIVFAIHVGRMQAEWTLVGFLASIVAVAGDVVSALLIALGVLGQARFALRRATWPPEGRGRARLLGDRRADARAPSASSVASVG